MEIKEPQLTIIECAYHRNGVSGAGFHVVKFDYTDEDKQVLHMVGILFGKTQCAVLDIDELQKGNIGFAEGNSWRGDNFEKQLRAYVKQAGQSFQETIDKSL